MEKRLSLALFLSFLVLVGWSLLAPRPEPPVRPGVPDPAATRDGAPAVGGELAPGRIEPGPPAFEPETAVVTEEVERELLVRTGRLDERGAYSMRFTNRGARLLELRLGDYFVEGQLPPEQRERVESWVPLLLPVESPQGLQASLSLSASASALGIIGPVPLEEALWSMRELPGRDGRPGGAEFVYAPGTGAKFTKRVSVVPGTHELLLEISLENEGGPRAGRRQFQLVPAASVPRASDDRFYVGPKAVVAYREGRDDYRLRQTDRRERPGRDVRGSFAGAGHPVFAGVHNKYFAFLLRPLPGAETSLIGAGWRRVQDLEFARENPALADQAYLHVDALLDLELFLPEPGAGPTTFAYQIYAGPKERQGMTQAFAPHGKIIEDDLGFFTGIARLIVAILGACHAVVGNWGWAIILMTLIIRLILFPLNRRAQTAMARFQTKMKRIQPRIDEVKKRYEKEPAKAREEQTRIMQEEGAFPPLGGCLPIFLQIPIFIGLFSALRVDFDLRQAPFILWIQDLSNPDRMLRLDFNTYLPFIGTIEYFNLLPILMVVLWVWQQRSMPKPTDPQQARMMKMMAFTPIIFGFLLYNYAAGLSLYMMTTSGFGIIETKVIRKLWPIDESEPAKKPKGFLARMMEKQMEQARRMQELQKGKQGQPPRGGPPGPRGKGPKAKGPKAKKR